MISHRRRSVSVSGLRTALLVLLCWLFTCGAARCAATASSPGAAIGLLYQLMEYDGASPSQLASIGAKMASHQAAGKPLALDALAEMAQSVSFGVDPRTIDLDEISRMCCIAIVSLKGAVRARPM